MRVTSLATSLQRLEKFPDVMRASVVFQSALQDVMMAFACYARTRRMEPGHLEDVEKDVGRIGRADAPTYAIPGCGAGFAFHFH